MIRFFLFQTIFSLCIIFSLGCSDENDLTSSQEMVQYSSLEKCSSSQQNMSSSSMQIESSSTINVSSSDEAMAGEGIINGVGSGRFAPKDTATRAHIATIIDKAFLK